MEYVVGFLMTASKEHIVLIRKTKPAWQAGKLNGIGGKIEAGETPNEAMVREFREETGATVTEWRNFATLSGNEDRRSYGEPWRVYFYVAFIASLYNVVKTTTEEEVVVIRNRPEIIKAQGLPNLNWLIPMACNLEAGLGFNITEYTEKRRH